MNATPSVERHVAHVSTSACAHCHMSVVLLNGVWRHLISGEVECAWKPDEQPLGMGYRD